MHFLSRLQLSKRNAENVIFQTNVPLLGKVREMELLRDRAVESDVRKRKKKKIQMDQQRNKKGCQRQLKSSVCPSALSGRLFSTFNASTRSHNANFPLAMMMHHVPSRHQNLVWPVWCSSSVLCHPLGGCGTIPRGHKVRVRITSNKSHGI